MRAYSAGLSSALLLLAALPALAAKPHHVATGHATIRHAATRVRPSVRAESHHLALATMPSDRAAQIQSALIRQGYLSGEPSGNWDSQSVAAMQKLQADNGWQTRLTPDSRALIKLGLGPQTATPPEAAAQPQAAPQLP